MPQSTSVLVAGNTLAEWARERRRAWSDEPLPAYVRPMPIAEVQAIEHVALEAVAQTAGEIVQPSAPAGLTASAEVAAVRRSPWRRWKACTTRVGALAVAAVERVQLLTEPAAWWLMRGAAVASTLSMVVVAGVNRGPLFARWDRVAAMVIAATNHPDTQPQPAAPPSGTGRLSVVSANGAAEVLIDGTPRGAAPVTIDLPAGAHRVLLKSDKGSVERAVRIEAGEPSELNEAIFPGWIALSTPIDVSLTEGGHLLKRDERGWAMLPPGPHDVQIDNRALGVHEVRRVVVTPGDTTRLSFTPHASTLSLTTNEPAEVWIDGALVGQAPLVDQSIALGVHDVRVRGALHERWLRVRATVQPVVFNVDLLSK